MSNIGPALVAAYLLSEILEDIGVFDDSKPPNNNTDVAGRPICKDGERLDWDGDKWVCIPKL